MSDISDRILYLVEKEAGGNAEKFGEMTGFSGQAIRNVSELKRNRPSLDLIKSILQTCVWISPDWLLFGKEPLQREKVDNSSAPPEWLLKRVEELAIENNDLKKELCRLTNSKKNNDINHVKEHDPELI
jgi:transcriptional regulator with XRE-family HTH domain